MPSSPEIVIVTPDGSTSSEIERIESLIAEFHEQQVQGTAPSVEEFLSLHPDVAEKLRGRLSASQEVSEATVEWDDSKTPSQDVSDVTHDHDSASSPVESIRRESAVGEKVGGYRLIRELGRGGMGIVYEGEHVETRRRVAIKLLSTSLQRTDVTVERFLKEASLAASLSHPRSTFVYEAGRDGDQFYTVMELMPGENLGDLVKQRGKLPVAQAVDYILDALDGLEAAHAVGIVHRDVKPSNCFLTEDGHVKIGDFGLSKSLVADSQLTMTGMFLGTPQFAAPEQIRHQDVDERTDIFALAVSLYYLIAGRAPFSGNPAAVIAQIVADKPRSLKSVCPTAPSGLSKVIDRAMQKDPNRRFPTMASFREALLPFSSRSSFSGIGRRVAAFAFDILLTTATGLVAALFLEWLFPNLKLDEMLNGSPTPFVQLAVMVLYFAICEGFLERTIGKWLFGLRVRSVTGERPGIVRATTRALVLPGVTFAMVSVYREAYFPSRSTQNFLQPELQSVLLTSAFYILECAAAGLVCITMRQKNGYRGLHDLLSSSCVIQPATSRIQRVDFELPRTVSVAAADTPTSIGPYRIVGQLGERTQASASYTVYDAIDDSLERAVWIYASPNKSVLNVPEQRASVARPTRTHWLQSGEEDGLHWFAVEAVSGTPLSQHESLPWSMGRKVVADTARELAAGDGDGSLPPDVSADHLWLEADGSVKLIDLPWWHSKDRSESGACGLMRRVIAKYCRGREASGGALDLALQTRFGNQCNIGELAAEACSAAESPSRIRWDDRLSVTMVMLPTEFMIALMLATAAGIASGVFFPGPFWLRYVAAALVPLTFVWISSVVFYEGGLAFRLCNFEVRRLDGQRPAAVRRMWRNSLAYLPIICGQTAFGTWIGYPYSSSFGDSVEQLGYQLWLVMLTIIFGALIALIGALSSVMSPRRGIQDLLAGTYLVRK